METRGFFTVFKTSSAQFTLCEKLREFVLVSFSVPSIVDYRERIQISARVLYLALAHRSQPFVERVSARYESVARAAYCGRAMSASSSNLCAFFSRVPVKILADIRG